MVDLMHKIESLEIEARNSFKATNPIMEHLNTMEIELRYLQNEKKFRLAQTEDKSKQTYLWIEGLDKRVNQSLVSQVATVFSKTEVTCKSEDIDFAHGEIPGRVQPTYFSMTDQRS